MVNNTRKEVVAMKKIICELIGLEFVKDEKDYFFMVETLAILEKASFWNEKYEKVFSLFLNKCTQEYIAEEVGVSQSTVSRMLNKIFKYLRDNA